MALELQSHSEKDTQRIAYALAQTVDESWFADKQEGVVIGLSGQLGAGKTEFVRGFMDYFSQSSAVASPSFVLECIYPVKNSTNIREVRHWDLYRLTASDDVVNELSEKTNSAVIIIEWPEKVTGVSDLLSLSIKIETPSNAENSRVIRLHGEEGLLGKISNSLDSKK